MALACLALLMLLMLPACQRPGPASVKPSRPESLPRESKPQESKAGAILDIAYKEIDGRQLKLFLYPAQPQRREPAPVLLYIHGGGFIAGDRGEIGSFREVLSQVRESGIAVASISYRLISAASRFPAPIEDCKDAVRWVRKNAVQYGFDPGRIGVWGASAGGHLALLAALTGPGAFAGDQGLAAYPASVRFAVSYYGPTSIGPDSGLVRHLDKNSQELQAIYKLASPITHLNKDSPATLLVHGANDHVVPVKHSQAFYQKAQEVGANCRLVTVKGGEHAAPGLKKADNEPGYAEIVAITAAFVRQQMGLQ